MTDARTAEPRDLTGLPTERLFGLDFVSSATIEEVAERLLLQLRDPAPGWRGVVTPNVDHLVRYDRYPDEAAVAARAGLVLPDGMPIVWASRILRRPLRRRLAGSDLFSLMWPRLADEDLRVVLVAPSEKVVTGLCAEHPGAVGLVPPMFDVADRATVDRIIDDVIESCARSGAVMVVVLLSGEKCHLIASRLAERWSGENRVRPVVALLGASGEFHLGLVERAPGWMQRSGLEWLHRLAGDPRRLARRYLVDDRRFVRLVWREWRAGRGSARGS